MTDQPLKLLIVEDTLSMALLYQKQLENAGYLSDCVESLAEAKEKQAQEKYDLLLLDLNLPDGDGLSHLDSLYGSADEIPALVITADASLNKAIKAMKLGALDYLVKPFSESRLLTTVANTFERIRLQCDLDELRQESAQGHHFQGFIGNSLPMQKVYRTIEQVAKSKATVFIVGHSGTGKEVCAEAIHQAGPRARRPFVPVNCAAIPKDLLESELFGHLKGSFTGAISDRLGAAKEASGGTLFLDEMCELDLNLQSKLLRFLQTGQVQSVGSHKPETVDVRVICATNKNPLEEVKEGRFREDLYFRLNVVPIRLPDLKDRDRDILDIAQYFLTKFSGEEGKKFRSFDTRSQAFLQSHSWPGNVRELQNTVRNITVLHDGDQVTLDMFPELDAIDQILPAKTDQSEGPVHTVLDATSAPFKKLSEIEREAIEERIRLCDGSIPLAAETLGVSPSTLYRKKEDWEKKKASLARVRSAG